MYGKLATELNYAALERLFFFCILTENSLNIRKPIYSAMARKQVDKWRDMWELLNFSKVKVCLVLLQLVALVGW
jgi:hypothetical protein